MTNTFWPVPEAPLCERSEVQIPLGNCLNVVFSSLASSEYPPEPTHSYDEDQRPEDRDYDLNGPAPTQVTMITEDSFPYVTTTESHYAKEDTETMQVGQPSTGSSLFFPKSI